MRIVISGIPIDVQKKNIKNMHLQVKPPDGHVVISAPLSVDDKAIEAYLKGNLDYNPEVHCTTHEHGHSCGEHHCGEEKHGCSGNGENQ